MPPLVIPAGLPSELLERRPDIAAAERRMAASNANIGVATAAFFPTVKLSGIAGFQSGGLDMLFDWPSNFWVVGPSLTLPLFQGGQLDASQSVLRQLEIAENRYRSGLATYLEVASAQNAALGIERTSVRLRGQQLVSVVALIKSLGGGWQAPESNANGS